MALRCSPRLFRGSFRLTFSNVGRAYDITRSIYIMRRFIVVVVDRDRNEIEVPIEAITKGQARRMVACNLKREYKVLCVKEDA